MWAVIDDWVEVPGLWTVPHTVAGKVLVGGPSNAGALFVDWARALLSQGAHLPARRRRSAVGPGDPEPLRRGDPAAVPVWTPYLRGERAPFHDTSLRAGLHDLDITHDAAAGERGAYEASGFVVRNMLDRAGITARRIVASGGGTQVLPWMQAMADASGLPVDTVAVPEGAALGAAYVARWRRASSRRSTGPSVGHAWGGGWSPTRAGPPPPTPATRASKRCLPNAEQNRTGDRHVRRRSRLPAWVARRASAMLGVEVTR